MSWTNRILFAVLIAAAVALLPRYEGVESDDLERVAGERQSLLEENAQLQRQILRIEAEVRSLKRTGDKMGRSTQVDRELARIAREDLNLVKSGEFVFELDRSAIAPAGPRP